MEAPLEKYNIPGRGGSFSADPRWRRGWLRARLATIGVGGVGHVAGQVQDCLGGGVLWCRQRLVVVARHL